MENKTFTDDEAIKLITGRIYDEQKKHEHSIPDWHEIAARKIYSQWKEYWRSQPKKEYNGLPSDEEIENESEKQVRDFDGEFDDLHDEYALFYSGAEWMRDIASSEIEALKAEIAELKNRTEWISVEDRLPEIKKLDNGCIDVLGLIEGKTVFTVAFFDKDEDCSRQRFYLSVPKENIFDEVTKEITHWMPIPPTK